MNKDKKNYIYFIIKKVSNKIFIKIIFALSFILLIIFIYLSEIFPKNVKLESHPYRILLYTCCNILYSHYIPIFCSLALRADKLKILDIEIGIAQKKLTYKEEKALNYLRKKYSYSKILIKYNFFIQNETGSYYDGNKVGVNSVRFISQPKIKNKYVYITDVDMLIFVENFYLYLIDDMYRRNSTYSNIVRPNTHRLTGLHFIEYDSFYPIPKQQLYNINDEMLLYNIVESKGIKIDYKTEYRPQFGIHASPSRDHVGSLGYIGWGADIYKFHWINYTKSYDFGYIYPLFR